jgi:hypothetical protein
MAQTIRAILLASAMAATFAGRRAMDLGVSDSPCLIDALALHILDVSNFFFATRTGFATLLSSFHKRGATSAVGQKQKFSPPLDGLVIRTASRLPAARRQAPLRLLPN